MQWRYEIDVVTDFLLVRRRRRRSRRRRKKRTSSGFCVLIMEGEECSVCGEGRLTLDPVYGVIACDVCGRVVNEMETQLASKHQMGHVMERGGTFVAAEDTGAIAAGGVSVYGDGSAANFHRNFINRQEMNKVGFPWTYSASTNTTTIKENFRVFLLCHEIWWVEIGFSLSSRGDFFVDGGDEDYAADHFRVACSNRESERCEIHVGIGVGEWVGSRAMDRDSCGCMYLHCYSAEPVASHTSRGCGMKKPPLFTGSVAIFIKRSWHHVD